MKKLLENYKGFEGVSTLVDVGGGIGATLNMIISKHPTIKGINFDLPHVIQDAPTYPGIKPFLVKCFILCLRNEISIVTFLISITN